MLHLLLLFRNLRVGSSEFLGWVASSVFVAVVFYRMPDSFIRIGWEYEWAHTGPVILNLLYALQSPT